MNGVLIQVGKVCFDRTQQFMKHKFHGRETTRRQYGQPSNCHSVHQAFKVWTTRTQKTSENSHMETRKKHQEYWKN